MSDFVPFFFWDIYFMNPANKVSLKEMQSYLSLSVKCMLSAISECILK